MTVIFYIKLPFLQKKALRIITFSNFNDNALPLFKELHMLKLTDIINLNNCLLAHNVINNKVPNNLKQFLTQSNQGHQLQTKLSLLGSVNLPLPRIDYGKFSIRYQAAQEWNKIIDKLNDLYKPKNITAPNYPWIQQLSSASFKRLLIEYYISQV